MVVSLLVINGNKGRRMVMKKFIVNLVLILAFVCGFSTVEGKGIFC